MKVSEFPIEIQELILLRQEEAGNPRDIEVFDDYPSVSAGGGGFNWDQTPEGHRFWNLVISHERFKVFYKKYPKKELRESITTFKKRINAEILKRYPHAVKKDNTFVITKTFGIIIDSNQVFSYHIGKNGVKYSKPSDKLEEIL